MSLMSMPSYLQLASLNSLSDKHGGGKDSNLVSQAHLRNLVQIIGKPTSSKTSDDYEILTSILQRVDFLKNMKIDVGVEINEHNRVLVAAAKKIKYQHFPAGNAVFHEGELDDKVYIVLQGSAISYIPTSQETNEKGQSANEVDIAHHTQDTYEGCAPGTLEDLDKHPRILFQPRKGKRFLKNLTTLGSLNNADEFSAKVFSALTLGDVEGNSNLPTCLDDSIENEEELEKDFEREVKPRIGKEYNLLLNFSETHPDKYSKRNCLLYKPIKLLQQGDYFGETALINNKPRTNTVIAYNDLHVITLKRQRYNTLLSGLSKNLNQNTQFLKDLLPGVSTTQYMKLSSLFEECYFSFNNQIFSQGETLDGFYIVREGEIQLCLTFQESKTRLKGPELSFSKEKKKHFIATVTRGEALGEENFFSNIKTKYSAIVSTPRAVLLKMKKSVYETLNGPCKSLFSFLMATSELKRHVRNQKMNEIIQTAQISHQVKTQKIKQAKLLLKQCPEEQPKIQHQFFFGQPLPVDLKCETEAKSFRRGYLLQDRYSKGDDFSSNLLPQKSSTTITQQEEVSENFLYDLIPPSKKKELMLFHKKKREQDFKSKLEGRAKKVAVKDDNKYKSYLHQLENAINCISTRNTIRPSVNIAENLGTSDIMSSRGALNQVLSPHVVHEKMPLFSDRSEKTSKSQKDSKLKLISPSTYRISPGYVGTEGSPNIKSHSRILTPKYGPTKIESPLLKPGNTARNKTFSLIDKLGEISVNNNHWENSTADYFGMSPKERVSSNVKRKLKNTSNSPHRTLNIHVESAFGDQASQSARLQDDNYFKLDLKKVLISSKHNMFRVKSNKKTFQEKHQTSRGSEMKAGN